MEKKWTRIYVVTTVVSMISLGYFLYIYMPPLPHMGGTPYKYILEMNITENEDCWNLTVVVLGSPYGDDHSYINSKKLIYAISDKNITWDTLNSALEKGTFYSIKNSTSSYGIVWIDRFNNGVINAGDYVHISKSAGNGGVVRSGYIFAVFTTDC